MSIFLENVCLSYPDGELRNTVLDNVNLTAERGSVTGLVGPSGSGKSSVLAICGLLKSADSGSVVLNGVNVSSFSPTQPTAFRRDNIGIIFQNHNLLSSLSVLDQLLLVASIGAGRNGSRRKPLSKHGNSHSSAGSDSLKSERYVKSNNIASAISRTS